jgi:hypothetical protein
VVWGQEVYKDTTTMLGSVQRSLFRFVGGYAIVDLYSNAVRVDTPIVETQQKKGWFSSGKSTATATFQPRQYEEDTIRGDVEAWIDDNQILALSVISLTVLGGGPMALAGAATSIVFDGEDGTERYITLKDDVLDWWEGSGAQLPQVSQKK